jgi:hypothetical protein
MVGTRKLARVLDHAERAHAKVVLVGDHRQLPEIDAGGVFRGLMGRLDPILLEENRRQRQQWERAALDELRAGTPATAITAYTDAGALTICATADETRETLVADWWEAHAQDGVGAGVMIAARVSDVEDLNDRARVRLAQAGVLTGRRLIIANREFREGDRIVALHNDRRLGLFNGTRAKVVSVDIERRELLARSDTGAHVRVPTAYLDAGYVAHAYAVTCHKAQGMTTERAWVLGSDEIYREWGYVALSRGREANRLYLVGGTRAAEDEHCHRRDHQQGDAVTQLAYALQRSRGQALAIDQAEAAGQTTDPADHNQLRALLVTAPHDVQRERQWLQEERDAAEEQLNSAQRRHAVVSAQLQSSAGRRSRGGRRDDIAAAHTQLQRAGTDVQRWRERLNDIDGRACALDASAAARVQWLGQNAGNIAAAKRAIDANDQAVWRAVQAAEYLQPGHVLAAIGPRPADPTERRAWRSAIRHIEQHRLRHGVSDPARALGERPHQEPQLVEYERANAAIQAVARAREQVAIHLERREPRMDHNLA